MIIAISVFNLIVNICIVVFLVYRYSPFYLSVSRTMWCNVPYSVSLMKTRSGNRRQGCYSSKGVFTFTFRNVDKLEKWDSEMLNSGEYKKYNQK